MLLIIENKCGDHATVEQLNKYRAKIKDPAVAAYGYLARTYSMPMIRLTIPPDMTVGRLTDIMVRLAASAPVVLTNRYTTK